MEGLDGLERSTAGAAATLQAEASRPKSREVVVLGLERYTEDQHKREMDTNTSWRSAADPKERQIRRVTYAAEMYALAECNSNPADPGRVGHVVGHADMVRRVGRLGAHDHRVAAAVQTDAPRRGIANSAYRRSCCRRDWSGGLRPSRARGPFVLGRVTTSGP